jgi:hypothetical protein
LLNSDGVDFLGYTEDISNPLEISSCDTVRQMTVVH